MQRFLATLFVGAITLACQAEQKSALPAVTFQKFEGGTMASSELSGKPIILNFWSPSWGTCVRELPELEAVYQEYKSQGLLVLGVSTTTKKEAVQGVIEEKGVTFPIFLDEYQVQVAFDNKKTPDTLFIDRSGKVIERTQEGKDKAFFEERAKQLLSQ